MNHSTPAQTFLQEAEDLLLSIEETALEVPVGEPCGEAVHQLFRAFHTIKGSGAMFGFDSVAAFTHHVETVLDKVRDGIVPVTAKLIDLILASKDEIKARLEAAQTGAAISSEKGDQLIASLHRLLPDANEGGPTPAAEVPTNATPAAGTLQKYVIDFRPAPGLLASGTNPIMLLDELRALGACQITASVGSIPPLEQLQPEQCHMAWRIELATSEPVNSIRDIFIFVEDLSEIRIAPAGPAEPSPSTAPAPLAATPVPGQASATGPAAAAASPTPSTVSSEAAPKNGAARKSSPRDAVVRVPSERLDRLVNLVGELVMNQSRLSQVCAGLNVAALGGPVEELERLVGELRDNVLGIRMMPIGTTVSRFKRLVHDLSRELNKEIELVTSGEETELDKTVLDQLGDPLVHVIRNCVDHGIETPEVRVRAGKPRTGTITLTAEHIGSNVVLSIEDDGRGIDTAAVRAKAIEKKLITPDAKLSEKEILDLIFLPGFSTAQRVTNVSGRGVGMDVVKRQFDALRGQIHLSSTPGKGTRLSFTLPLTLAIIDGLLVEIGQDQFIVPMSVVTENVELQRQERARSNGRNVIAVRGELVPYVRLRETFEVAGEELDIEKIVIVRQGHERVGLVVDRVLGSHQTVIQSLGRFYRDIKVCSGATVMGDGRVALILDPARLVASQTGCATGPSPLIRLSSPSLSSTHENRN